MPTDPEQRNGRARRFMSQVYGPRDSRSMLDSPWWLALLAVFVVSVLTFGGTPLKWLAVPLAMFFFWLPACVRWGLGLWRSVVAFREGYRS